MSQDFLNPYGEISTHGKELPHWQQEQVLQFVTFRLKDSVPQSKLREWQQHRNNWLANNPKPWNREALKEYNEEVIAPFENWLDRGMGRCLLKGANYREELTQVLQYDAGQRAEFISWVIMPNHVHLLFKPLCPLPDLIRNWKSLSARAIRQGPIWQRNYRDTLIRNEKHFSAVVRYIRNNPRKLSSVDYTLWESSRAQKIV